MALLLARIDDRLIHGQVVIGCCEPLSATHIVLADDAVAKDPLQSRLFQAAAPPAIEVSCVSIDEAATMLAAREGIAALQTTVLVVRSCASMLRLCEAGAPIEHVNVGGMHRREGAVEIWPGFYLDPEDESCLRRMLDLEITVEVQSVVGAPCEDAAPTLESRRTS